MDAKAGQLGVHYFRSEVVRVEVLMLLWAGIECGTLGRRYTRGRVFSFANDAIDRFCVGSMPT